MLSERCGGYDDVWQTPAEYEQSAEWICGIADLSETREIRPVWFEGLAAIKGRLGATTLRSWAGYELPMEAQVSYWAGPVDGPNRMPDVLDAWLVELQAGEFTQVLATEHLKFFTDDLERRLTICRSPWTTLGQSPGLHRRTETSKPPQAVLLTKRDRPEEEARGTVSPGGQRSAPTLRRWQRKVARLVGPALGIAITEKFTGWFSAILDFAQDLII